MDLEQAKEVLKEMQDICRYKTYKENEERDEWKREYQAIKVILNTLDLYQSVFEKTGQIIHKELEKMTTSSFEKDLITHIEEELKTTGSADLKIFCKANYYEKAKRVGDIFGIEVIETIYLDTDTMCVVINKAKT